MRVTDSIKQNKHIKNSSSQNKKTPQQSPFILGVAGGSGSGKTFFAKSLQKILNAEKNANHCEIVYQDNFYIDQSKNFDFDGGSVNFDHPSSLDFNLLAKQISNLKSGEVAQIPVYDFVTHSRQAETLQVKPRKVIIVDGILIFHSNPVRKLFDDLIFFDTPEELRFERRLARDVQERGREPGGVKAQFYKQVKPMHDLFVEPSKVHARTVVRETGEFDQVLRKFSEKLIHSLFS